ncbi:MAG: Amuc_1098 family type IV pilus outer membrane protein [Verrucomicrobiota bacterium]
MLQRFPPIACLRVACVCALAFSPLSFLSAGEKGVSASSLEQQEKARRQAALVAAEARLAEARLFQEQGRDDLATEAYREAFEMLPPGEASQNLRQKAIRGFARHAVRQAEALGRDGRFAEADALLAEVLRPEVHPDYEPAKVLRRQLLDPERFAPAMTPGLRTEIEQVVQLLEDGGFLLSAGQYNQARDKYEGVLRIDPTNEAARQGLERVETAISDYLEIAHNQGRATMLREVDEGWETVVPLKNLVDEFGDLAIDSPLELLERGLESKLESIVLEAVDFRQVPFEEVINFLALQSIEADRFESDPEKKGINFLIGLAPSAPARQAEVTLSLQRVPVSEVLRYATQAAGVSYVVEPFAIKILSRGDGDGTLFVREYRVPPNFLSVTAGSEASGVGDFDPFASSGPASSNGLLLERVSVEDFLKQAGVVFGDGAYARYVSATSSLLVRNTQSGHNLVRDIVDSVTDESPRQVQISTRVVEVIEDDVKELGFDWLLGSLGVSSDRAFISGGTEGGQSEFLSSFPATAAGPFNPVTAGNRSGEIGFTSDPLDGVLAGDIGATGSGTRRSPGVLSVVGAMTDPQFQVVARALSQKKGTDLLIQPSVVTKSGQRARIDIFKEFWYPSEYDPPELPDSVGFAPLEGIDGDGDVELIVNAERFPVTPANPTAFVQTYDGVSLEVDPIIDAGGKLVELNLVPEVREFEGFVNYGTPITELISGAREPTVRTENRILQPVFRIIRNQTSVSVYDGQTLVMGGLLNASVSSFEDKVPLLGDIPIFGRLFRTQGKQNTQRIILIFVKVDVIDPSGQQIRGG